MYIIFICIILFEIQSLVILAIRNKFQLTKAVIVLEKMMRKSIYLHADTQTGEETGKLNWGGGGGGGGGKDCWGTCKDAWPLFHALCPPLRGVWGHASPGKVLIRIH